MAETTERKSKRWLWILILILIVVLVPVGIWFYKNQEIKNLTEDFGHERIEMKQQFENRFMEEQRNHARLMVKPLTWAVRAEMLRENLEQVNQYLTQFVKEDNIQQVILVNDKGQVIVSTDKKIENTPFAANHNGDMLSVSEVTLTNQANGELAITAPVMGLDTRLGTLIVFYQPDHFEETDSAKAEEPAAMPEE